MLLRLYPRPFRERFGEGMAQTFHDLCRVRLEAKRGLFGFALWIFFETLMGIVRENATQMIQLKNPMLRAALVALVLWMVPVVAAQFVEDWHWGVGGFVFAYVLFFGTALAYQLIAGSRTAWAYKAAVGLALVVGFVTGWTNMVHMSESENPVNALYFGVLVVGGVGAWLARLHARGMALAMFVMAATLAVVTLLDISLALNVPSPAEKTIAMVHIVFAALFAASGLLFQRASLVSS